jgi:hypothetical protein
MKRWGARASGAACASAANLAAYIALRRHDLRDLQVDLAARGLSSLGRCEGHVLESLDAVIDAVQRFLGKTGAPATRRPSARRRTSQRVCSSSGPKRCSGRSPARAGRASW